MRLLVLGPAERQCWRRGRQAEGGPLSQRNPCEVGDPAEGTAGSVLLTTVPGTAELSGCLEGQLKWRSFLCRCGETRKQILGL